MQSRCTCASIPISIDSCPGKGSTHPGHLSIGWSGKVGVVGTRTILYVEDNSVITNTALTVVIGLEVAGLLVEAKSVEEIVICVCSVEQLGNGSINICCWGSCGGGVWVLEDRLGVCGSVVVQVGGTAGRIVLSNAVVTTGRSVCCSASAQPAELGCSSVPWVGENLSGPFSGVVDSPGAIRG